MYQLSSMDSPLDGLAKMEIGLSQFTPVIVRYKQGPTASPKVATAGEIRYGFKLSR